MKATITETENLDGKRIWIVGSQGHTRSWRTKVAARKCKNMVDEGTPLQSIKECNGYPIG